MDRTTCTQQRAACYKNGHTLWSIAVRMSTLILPSTTVTVSTSEVTWRDDDVSRCADDWRVRMRSEMSSTSPVLLTTGSRSTVSCWRPSKLTVVASVLNTPTHSPAVADKLRDACAINHLRIALRCALKTPGCYGCITWHFSSLQAFLFPPSQCPSTSQD